jgi:hypothetical protein
MEYCRYKYVRNKVKCTKFANFDNYLTSLWQRMYHLCSTVFAIELGSTRNFCFQVFEGDEY